MGFGSHRKVTFRQDGQIVIKSENKTHPDANQKKENSDVSSRCCLTLFASSEAETVKMYPRVLGTYKMVNSRSSYYKHDERNVYLSKPKGSSFTWGVNSSPHRTWGWVRPVRDEECPEEVTQWAVYDQASRKWTRDNSFRIRCVES